MIQQLRSVGSFSNTLLGAHNCPVPDANTLSWSPQALRTCDTQMYRQTKIFIHIKQKQKEKLSVQITQMFSNCGGTCLWPWCWACPPPVTLSHLFCFWDLRLSTNSECPCHLSITFINFESFLVPYSISMLLYFMYISYQQQNTNVF